MLYLLFCCFLCSRLVQNNIGMCLALSYLNAFSLEFASFSVILLRTHWYLHSHTGHYIAVCEQTGRNIS